MDSLSRRERASLCATLEAGGPEAPTLCAGWNARQLAAHLVLREGHPAATGMVLRPLSGWTKHTQNSLAATDFSRLVHRVATGPPRWSPLRLPGVEPAVNTVEFFVHHEDLRRASPSWTPRVLAEPDEQELWRLLQRRARLLLRHSPVGVELATTAPPRANQFVAHQGGSPVTLAGLPSELALYLHGRQAHSLVELTGPAEGMTQFEALRLRV
jgi:uncharacterized protein (TIGR03085 family)